MSHWQTDGASDEWYTPKYIFDALGEVFDTDVAHPANRATHVPCDLAIWAGSLEGAWGGFIWMNPPFGGRNGLVPWLDKFAAHGNGIALTPDRTSAPWFQDFAPKMDAVLFVAPKVKFERPDGSLGASPSGGTALWAAGPRAVDALKRGASLGLLLSIRSAA